MASLPVRNMQELQTILSMMDQKNPLISMMLEFEVRTGLRNCDVGAITFQQVMINGVVKSSFTVVQSKGYRMRTNRVKNPMSEKAAKQASQLTITINEELADLIKQIHHVNGKHKLMFQSTHHHAKVGRPITRQYINRVLKEIATTLQLPYQLSTHSLRKTFAMMLRKSGADMKHLKEALGHSSVAITDRYIATFDDETSKFVTGISLPLAGELTEDNQ
ncbi:tyrosine-type recombinase/integrase [Vibrio parahaemolyticus]|uniref:tyrosine-type recombinase/integrase n=1 Tax=Vibrio parahaemolyticus TaxID=670 RepID=UPI003D81AA29